MRFLNFSAQKKRITVRLLHSSGYRACLVFVDERVLYTRSAEPEHDYQSMRRVTPLSM